jgi:hypothetical protein
VIVFRIAAAGVLLSSLAFVPPAAADAPACATKGHTVVANAKARVYRVGNAYDGKFYGCAYGSERRRFLGYYTASSSYEKETAFFRLIGRRVGYANLDYTGEGVTGWDAKVVDLRLRKVTRHTSWDGGLDDLRMTGSGSLALLSDDGASSIDGDGIPNPVSRYTVAKVERDGRTVLDRGKDIDPDSLAVARRRVYWTRAGKPHSAPIE